MGVRMRRVEQFSVDQEALLDTFVSHIALAVERELLEDRLRQAAVVAESERLYATLLDSVSQELRTPIATMREATSRLLEAHRQGDEKAEIARRRHPGRGSTPDTGGR
jgi:K+-sensing histidine kinase KdpD